MARAPELIQAIAKSEIVRTFRSMFHKRLARGLRQAIEYARSVLGTFAGRPPAPALSYARIPAPLRGRGRALSRNPASRTGRGSFA